MINPTSPLGWGGLGLRFFQSSNWEGLPFPLPPSLGCGSGGSRVGIGFFFGARFEPHFVSRLGSPQNRYHKLFRRQNGLDLESKAGSKTSSHFGTVFFRDFSRFSHFFHTTSSASRIAPAISKPHFRLSSFLLFLLSLRPSFWRVFGYKMGIKTNPKTEPETRPLKKLHSSEWKIPCSKKGSKKVPQKGRRCGMLSSFLLRCCFLLDFGAFRPYFGP